jgi:hypothetical protein
MDRSRLQQSARILTSDEYVIDSRAIVVVSVFKFDRILPFLASYWHLSRIKRWARHHHGDGLLAGTGVASWRKRELTTFSLWSAHDSIGLVGQSDHHVRAAHIVLRYAMWCESAYFSFSGDWAPLLGQHRESRGWERASSRRPTQGVGD